MKVSFESALKQVLKWEGSEFTNDPDDRGGATKYGIIQTRYDEYRTARNLTRQSVRLITMPEVEAIYEKYYWDVCRCDDLPAIVDTVVFDAAVNHGPARAAKWLQKIVSVVADGQIGPATIKAVNEDVASSSARQLATLFCDRRESFYEEIAIGRQGKFLKGWMNRLNDLRKLFGLKDTDGVGK